MRAFLGVKLGVKLRRSPGPAGSEATVPTQIRSTQTSIPAVGRALNLPIRPCHGTGRPSLMRHPIHLTIMALVGSLAASAGQAQAQAKLDAQYSVYLTGIPIGKGAIVLELSESGYAAAGSARFTGLLRMVSRGEGTSTVRGTLANGKVHSSVYAMNSKSTERTEKVEIQIANGYAKDFLVEPPPDRNDATYRVPITDLHRRNVVDPLSAGLIFVPGTGDLVSPASCARTLPIFDARVRYDVVLSYLRTEKAPQKIEGYSGPVIVCQARYVPISGHRNDRPQVQQMADNKELFVWLAPIAGTRMMVPVRVSISTMIGTLVVEATHFRVENRLQPATR